jgi:uncharacterized protein YciI
MNKTILFAVMVLIGGSISAQIDTAGFETFAYKEADSTFLMKKYYMLLYKAGPDRSQDEEEAMEIQKGHLANINTMATQRVVCMAGPFQDSPDYAGALIFSVKDTAVIHKWMQKDPAVTSGRLTYEIHPWWAAVGSQLF